MNPVGDVACRLCLRGLVAYEVHVLRFYVVCDE